MILMSKQTDYAVQLLIALSELGPEKRLSLRQFGVERTISVLFLQKIVRKLKAGGFIDADKGTKGGYYLRMPADRISLKDIMDTLEGGCAPTSCTKDKGSCSLASSCHLKDAFFQIKQDISAVMQGYSIADMKRYATSR